MEGKSQSSAILEDCLDTPGSFALWVGLEHQLNRVEERELVGHHADGGCGLSRGLMLSLGFGLWW